jgi:hypothetical protein
VQELCKKAQFADLSYSIDFLRVLGYNSNFMQNLFNISRAGFWLVLCLGIAMVLLVTAILYNIYVSIKKSLNLGRISMPNIRLAK